MPTQRDILAAISLERATTPEFYSFTVTGTEREGVVWKVFVDVKSSHASSLDESFEGSRAWWGGEPTGTADALSVDPERKQINLRFASNCFRIRWCSTSMSSQTGLWCQPIGPRVPRDAGCNRLGCDDSSPYVIM